MPYPRISPHFPPRFSPFFPIFPHFSPFSPIFPIFPWPKKDLETPGWETSKAWQWVCNFIFLAGCHRFCVCDVSFPISQCVAFASACAAAAHVCCCC